MATARPRHRLFALAYDLASRLDRGRMEPLRELVAGKAEGRVLEIGCGTGANFEHYAWSRIDSLTATEPDPYMLSRARAKARKLPLLARETLELIEAPAEELPFPDAHFHTVVATLVLCSVTDLHASLNEIRRVLRPSGSLRFLEHVQAEGRARSVQEFVQPLYGWLAAGCRLDRPTERVLRDAGFRVEVEMRPKFGPLHPAVLGVAFKED